MPILDISVSTESQCTEFESDIRKVVITDYILDNISTEQRSHSNLEIIFEDDFISNEENLKDNTVATLSSHGQFRCKDLKHPFAVSKLHKVGIESVKVIKAVNYRYGSKGLLEITLDITDKQDLTYWQPGSTIGILPRNLPEEVDELLDKLDLRKDADRFCYCRSTSSSKSKKPIQVPVYIPVKTTPREILQDCVNIRCVLKKKFLQILSTYCTDINESRFLNSLSVKEGTRFYQELCIERRLTLIDVLSLCPSCKPSLEVLVEFLPRLMPRPYSIIDSPLECVDKCRIIVSIEPIKYGVKEGITTRMLQDKLLKHVYIYLRQPTNCFSYTEDEFKRNQLLIAIGSAVAPFLSFLQHKSYLIQKHQEAGQAWLILGATSSEAIPHRQKLLDYTQTISSSGPILHKFVECHSRGNEGLTPYRHVQDALSSLSEEITDYLLRDKTDLYVCADGATISKDIEDSICNCLTKELNIEAAQAKDMIKQYRSQGKYREEIWL